MNTYTLIVKQDGKTLATFTEQPNDFKGLKYIQNHQGQSFQWATTYGGWSLEMINEQTKESEFVK